MKSETIVLVTGGTGFVGIHTILQLLEQGYQVRTTLRSLNRKKEILDALHSAGITNPDQLSFYEADLQSDGGWNEAIKDCQYVLHVASPFPASQPVDENELIIPAREGALRVLKASRDAGVKRVVLTSSFAAVGYSKKEPGYVFTENDWTDPNSNIQAYIKSKTLAEKSAWDFIANEGGKLELSVINPTGIFGPMLGDISSASLDTVIKTILDGTVKETPDVTFGVIDVRDVADIHIKAMLHPDASGERFVATADGVVSFYDIAQVIKKDRPERAKHIAELKRPGEAVYIKISNEKAKKILNFNPRSIDEAILASVDSLTGNY